MANFDNWSVSQANCYGVRQAIVPAVREEILKVIDPHRNTTLHIIARTAQIAALQLALPSLQRGDLEIRNEFGLTPLNAVCDSESPSEEVMKLLLSKGADPNTQANPTSLMTIGGKANYSPLHMVVSKGLIIHAKIFIAHNAKVDALGGPNKDITPLNAAIGINHVALAELLCAHGAITLTGKKIPEISCLAKVSSRISSRHRDLALIKVIVASMKKQSGYLDTLKLHFWEFWKLSEFLDYFLTEGVKPDKSFISNSLCYPGTYCDDKKTRLDTLRVLLKHKVFNVNDRFIRNRTPEDLPGYKIWYAETPFEWAISRNALEIADLLREFGAKAPEDSPYLKKRFIRLDKPSEIEILVKRTAAENGTIHSIPSGKAKEGLTVVLNPAGTAFVGRLPTTAKNASQGVTEAAQASSSGAIALNSIAAQVDSLRPSVAPRKPPAVAPKPSITAQTSRPNQTREPPTIAPKPKNLSNNPASASGLRPQGSISSSSQPPIPATMTILLRESEGPPVPPPGTQMIINGVFFNENFPVIRTGMTVINLPTPPTSPHPYSKLTYMPPGSVERLNRVGSVLSEYYIIEENRRIDRANQDACDYYNAYNTYRGVMMRFSLQYPSVPIPPPVPEPVLLEHIRIQYYSR